MTKKTNLCGCHQTLWITLDDPVGKPVENLLSRERDSMPVPEDKSSRTTRAREAVIDALIDAVDINAARISAIEDQLIEIIGILNAPLTYEERIGRVRQVRQEMGYGKDT